MTILMRRAATVAIAVATAGCLLAPGFAASPAADAPAGPAATPKPDPEKGRDVAERLCTGCHLVDPRSRAADTVPADVPSFAAIAGKDGQTLESLAGRIVIPHPPMPAIALSRDEIRDVVAYIMTLATQEPEER